MMNSQEQPSSSSFGALLRRYRGERGLSQEEVAARAELSVQAVSALERGLTQWPYRDTVARLASALELAPDERRGLEAAARRPVRRQQRSTEPAAAPPPVAEAIAAVPEESRPALPPYPLTTLIGRDVELERIAHLLTRPGGRLLTVTGPGGIGKTRLAIEVAHRLASQHGTYPNGVIFAELAPLQDGTLVPAAIAEALGVRETPGRSLDASLREIIGQRTLLLVLDNCEHLIEACAALVTHLLGSCPQLRVLATSRTALRLRGEQMLPLAPLALPSAASDTSSAALHDSPAVTLFVERASAVNPDFVFGAANASDVAAICRRLDGLPLALELAAARLLVLSPATLLARLDQRLALLTDGPRDLPARQQTLRAAIAWSYDLLPLDEQRVFRALAVCAGGCTLEAAAALCALEATDPLAADPLAMMRQLEALVGASLLVPVQREADEPRFAMLETLREYGLEVLAAHGELALLQARHAAYFGALALAGSAHLHGSDQQLWLERLEVEHDNLRAALTWALESGAAEQGLRLAASLARFWGIRGHLSEGRRWLEQLLAAGAGVAPLVRASGAREAGMLATYQGDHAQAASLLAESLTLCRELGDTPGIIATLQRLADLAYSHGDFGRAEALFAEALTLARQESDPLAIAVALTGLGNVANERGEYALAAACYQEGLDVVRALGDVRRVTIVLNNLGNVAYAQRDFERATTLHEENVAVRRALGDRLALATALGNLAKARKAQGDLAQAQAHLDEALALAREVAARRTIALTLMYRTDLWLEQGHLHEAAVDAAEALAGFRAVGDKRGIALALEAVASVVIARMQQTRSMNQEVIMWAVRLCAAVAALRASIGVAVMPVDRAATEQRLAAAHALLGEQTFEVAWAEGRTLSLDDALTLAEPANIEAATLPLFTSTHPTALAEVRQRRTRNTERRDASRGRPRLHVLPGGSLSFPTPPDAAQGDDEQAR